MRITKPKFVKNANSWCVTTFSQTKTGEDQKINWFPSQEEAESFHKQSLIDNKDANTTK